MANRFANLDQQVSSKERRVVVIRPLSDRFSIVEPMVSAPVAAVVLGKRVERDLVLSVSPKKLKSVITVRRSIAGNEAFGLVTAEDKGKKKRVGLLVQKIRKLGLLRFWPRLRLVPCVLLTLQLLLSLVARVRRRFEFCYSCGSVPTMIEALIHLEDNCEVVPQLSA